MAEGGEGRRGEVRVLLLAPRRESGIVYSRILKKGHEQFPKELPPKAPGNPCQDAGDRGSPCETPRRPCQERLLELRHRPGTPQGHTG